MSEPWGHFSNTTPIALLSPSLVSASNSLIITNSLKHTHMNLRFWHTRIHFAVSCWALPPPSGRVSSVPDRFLWPSSAAEFLWIRCTAVAPCAQLPLPTPTCQTSSGQLAFAHAELQHIHMTVSCEQLVTWSILKWHHYFEWKDLQEKNNKKKILLVAAGKFILMQCFRNLYECCDNKPTLCTSVIWCASLQITAEQLRQLKC